MREAFTKRTLFGHLMVPFFTALYMTLFPANTPMMAENSGSYLNFSDIHALGYPFFISLTGLFNESPEAIILAQIWFFAFALTCLSLSIRRVSGNSWLALLSILSISFNPFLQVYHYSIQPYSLFLSFSLIMMSALIFAFGQARFRSLFCFGLFLGLCITVNDFGWGFLILIFFAAPILASQKNCTFFKAFLVPLIMVTVVVLFEATTYTTLHERDRENQVASHLFVRSAMMQSHQTSPYAGKDPRTVIWAKIETDLQDKRESVWALEDFTTKENQLIQSEEEIRLSFAPKEFEFAQTVLDKSRLDIEMDIASSRIIQDPLAFLEISVIHYQGLWESEEMITYAFWLITMAIVLFSLWNLIAFKTFNGAFAASFICALGVQMQTMWVAITGLGPESVVLFLSPFLSLSLCFIIIGVYVTFINPIHTYD